jgi:hypothetical protein
MLSDEENYFTYPLLKDELASSEGCIFSIALPTFNRNMNFPL